MRTQHYARPRITRLTRIEMAPNIRGSLHHQCSNIGVCQGSKTQMNCVCSSRPTSDSLTIVCLFVFLNCVFTHAAAFATDDNSLSLDGTIWFSYCTHDLSLFASSFAPIQQSLLSDYTLVWSTSLPKRSRPHVSAGGAQPCNLFFTNYVRLVGGIRSRESHLSTAG